MSAMLETLVQSGRRARLAIKHYGVWTTLSSVPGYLWRFLGPGQVDRELYRQEKNDPFDARHGVETVRHVDVFEMEGVGAHELANNSPYSPTPVRTAKALLAALPIDPSGFTFVDYGCGKGRVMLLASFLPFKRIVGIDFSASMTRAAEQNLARFRPSEPQRCTSLEVHCSDAIEFELPPGDLVLYFYQPFTVAVARQVLARLEASLRERPRQVHVICVGHNHRRLFAELPYLRLRESIPSEDGAYFDAALYAVVATPPPA